MRFLIATRQTSFAHGCDQWYRRSYGQVCTRPEIAGTFAWYWDKALKVLGHETHLVVLHPNESIDVSSPLYHRGYQALARVAPYTAWRSWRAGSRLVRAVAATRPDVVLIDTGELLEPSVLRAIKRRFDPVLALWLLDDPLRQRWHRVVQALPVYDVIGTFDREHLATYQPGTAAAWVHLPCAFDADIYQPRTLTAEERRRYSAPVSFVGTLHEHRISLLRAIVQRGIPLSIWTWNPELLRNDPALYACYRGGVHGEGAASVYLASDISLNIHHPQSRSGVNMRTFEIAATGGFQLVDYQEGLGEAFRLDDEVVAFHTTDELMRKITHYLLHDADRSAIAQQAQLRAQHEHSFVHRMRVLSEAITSWMATDGRVIERHG